MFACLTLQNKLLISPWNWFDLEKTSRRFFVPRLWRALQIWSYATRKKSISISSLIVRLSARRLTRFGNAKSEIMNRLTLFVRFCYSVRVCGLYFPQSFAIQKKTRVRFKHSTLFSDCRDKINRWRFRLVLYHRGWHLRRSQQEMEKHGGCARLSGQLS